MVEQGQMTSLAIKEVKKLGIKALSLAKSKFWDQSFIIDH